MRKLIEKTPGYRISDNGYVYGGGFDKKKLRSIRDQIRNGFMLRPAQLGRMLSTMHQTELLTYGQMLRLSLAAPLVVTDHVSWRTQRAIRRFRERRLDRQAALKPAEAAVPASPTE
jgi:hypothetical protein